MRNVSVWRLATPLRVFWNQAKPFVPTLGMLAVIYVTIFVLVSIGVKK
jgi:hypothetical protein